MTVVVLLVVGELFVMSFDFTSKSAEGDLKQFTKAPQHRELRISPASFHVAQMSTRNPFKAEMFLSHSFASS